MGAIPRSVSVLCAFLCALCVTGTSGEYRHHRKCSHLKHEFVHQHFGDRELIYDTPTHDPAVSICYDGSKEPNQSTCCSAGAERKFLEAAEEYFKTSILQSFTQMKQIQQDLVNYEEQLVQRILAAKSRASMELTSMHKVPETQHHAAVSAFFLDLEQYVRRRGAVNMEDAVNQFFSALFPPVYSYALSDPSLVSYSQSFLDCLQQNQEDIAPFGNDPHRLKNRLTQTLSRSVAYMNTLAVLVEALNQSQPAATIDPDCLRAVARLRFCGRCHGHLETPVCHGFCLNVFRGCLADVSEISPEWDELVGTLESLGKTLQSKFSAEDLLAHLDRDISDAILQAMDDGRRISTMVKEKCPEDHGKGDSNYKPPETQNVTPRPTTSRPLAEQVGAHLKLLKDTRGMYNRLGDVICRNTTLYEQDMRSEQCWNGTAIAQYMRDVPEANVISQARFNQELSVTAKPNYRLLQVREKLTHARKNLTDLLNKGQQMLGDRPSSAVYNSGAGSSRPIVFNEMDDEDLYNQGSGSGYEASGDHTTRLPATDRPGDKEGRITTQRPGGPSPRGGCESVARTSWSMLAVAMVTALAPYFLRV